jgi:Uma2 family endonuclease
MKRTALARTSGPFRVDQLRPGDPYELSNGHPIFCAPTGKDGGQAVMLGAEVIGSDPDAEEAGVDTGFALDEKTLRAPDVAVGGIRDEPGWAKEGPPKLAIEYAGKGQDETELQRKIEELLAAGTLQVWVVRLLGKRHVEAYRRGRAPERKMPGEMLVAEGVLRNPVPVEALFHREAAHEQTLRNLLQRRGYASLDEVRAEGRQEGRQEGRIAALREALLTLLDARGLKMGGTIARRIGRCSDERQLMTWTQRAGRASTASEVFGEGSKPSHRRRSR